MGSFEKLITFTITTTKVTDEAIKAWTGRTYEPGPLKAAYGTFLTGLTTIWLHDKLADELAEQCNTTWTRVMPAIIQVGITDAWTAYTHIPDQNLGIKATGDHIEAFNFLRGLYLPLIEQLTLAGQNTTSSISLIGQAILNGREFQITFDQEKNIIHLEVEGLPGISLTINATTGEVKDSLYGLGGATAEYCYCYCYCYHNQLTDNVNNWLGQFLKSTTESTVAGILITAGLLAVAAGAPEIGALAIVGGIIAAAKGSGVLDNPRDPYNWLDFAVTVGSAVFFKAPIEVSPFKVLITRQFRNSMKFMRVLGGKRVIVEATLGRNGKEAIENAFESWVKGSGISSVIHLPEQLTNNSTA